MVPGVDVQGFEMMKKGPVEIDPQTNGRKCSTLSLVTSILICTFVAPIQIVFLIPLKRDKRAIETASEDARLSRLNLSLGR